MSVLNVLPFISPVVLNYLGNCQGSKLTLANSQDASDFDKLRVRNIFTSKRLRFGIIHVSQLISKEFASAWSHQFASRKSLTSKTLQVD